VFKLDFFRPFSRHGTARASAALPIRLSENVEFLSSISCLGNSSRLDCTRLNEMVRFQQSFSLHGKARASAALPIWLSENVGLSFEQVGREAIRPGCPTLGSEIHAVVHSSGFVFFESFRFGCLRPFFRLGIARISLGFAFGLTKTLLMLTKINKEFVCCNTYRKKKIIFYLFRSRVFGFDRKRNSSGAARAVAGNAEK